VSPAPGADCLGDGAHRAVTLLAVRVGERAAAPAGGDCADRDDPGGRRAAQRGHQVRGEGEVAEVVGAKGELEPVGGGPALRDVHHAGIADQRVQGPGRGGVGGPRSRSSRGRRAPAPGVSCAAPGRVRGARHPDHGGWR